MQELKFNNSLLKALVFLLGFWGLLPGLGYGQLTEVDWTVEQEISALLQEEGFQNIVVQLKTDTLSLAYENRVYRFEIDAIRKIIDQVALPLLNANVQQLVLLVQSRGIPVMSIEMPVVLEMFYNQSWPAIVAQMAIRMPADKEVVLEKKNRINGGQYAFEFSIGPQLKLALGGNPDPFVHQLNLLPSLRTFLWKGASLTTQLIIPVSNEFSVPEDKIIRPGLLSFHQVVRLPGKVFSRFSAGYFTRYRYGMNLESGRFFLKNRLFLNGQIGYTGYASYPIRLGYDQPEKGWQFSPLSYWNYQLGASYRIPQWDLTIGLSYAKVLYNKKALSLTCTRQFDEVDIGFYAYQTNDGENYGFTLSIPIYPRKYFRPGRFHVRPARHFQQRYQGTLHFATTYDTGEDLSTFFKKLQPDFIKNQLINN